MFKWLRKLFRINTKPWVVQGWDSEQDKHYGYTTRSGPYKNEKEAIAYGIKSYGKDLFEVSIIST